MKFRFSGLLVALLMLIFSSLIWAQGMETFDNLDLTGTAYADGAFAGQDGSSWSYTQCRGDLEITGKSIMLGRDRNPQATFSSGTLSNGIGMISFDYMQAFSSNVNLNVLVNDNVVGNVTSDAEANVIKHSGDIVVNVDGDFVLKFISVNNSDGQVVVDNISWTQYGGGTPSVSLPTFSPMGGTFYETINVSISTSTEGATIYYTLDGSDPSESSAEYTAPIEISETTTVKAIAYKDGMNPSNIATSEYAIEDIPDVMPIADIQNNESAYEGQLVTIEGVVTIGDGLLYSGKTKFYVQDDSGRGIMIYNGTSLPTTYVRGDKIHVMGTVTKYYSDVEITNPTVTLISQGNALPTPCAITGSEDETLNGTWGVASGTINDIYDSGTMIKITIDVNGTDIPFVFWNTTGADVSQYQLEDEVQIYGVIAFYSNELQAVCGYETDISYVAGDTVITPAFSPAGGTYYETINVSITSATEGATIYYTLDGSEPSEASTEYTASIEVSENTTIKAKAYKAGMTASNVATAEYVIESTPDTMPIADIQNDFDSYDGQLVTVEGVVTIGDGLLYSGKTKFYLQDNSGRGVLVFNNTPLATTYVRGDKVLVTGTVTKYNSDVEITDPTVTLISQGNDLPAAYVMTGTEAETFNGTWARAKGIINDIYDSGSMIKITIDVNGTDTPLVFWNTTGADVSEYQINDEVVAYGAITFYNSAIQLTCGYDADIMDADAIEINVNSSFYLKNSPNPFNPVTTIFYKVPAETKTREAMIFNLLGQKVYSKELTSNEGSFVWTGVDIKGNNVPSGVYFYKIIADSKVLDTQKMLLVK